MAGTASRAGGARGRVRIPKEVWERGPRGHTGEGDLEGGGHQGVEERRQAAVL